MSRESTKGGKAVADVSKLLSGNVLAKLFGAASLVLFARVLPKTELAILPAWLMMMGLPTLFLSFGTLQILIRKLPSLFKEDESGATSLVVTVSAVVLAGTSIVCLISLPFAGSIAEFFFRDPEQAWIVRVAVPGCLAAAFASVANHVLWGSARYGNTSLLQITESILRPCLTISLYLVWGIKGLVLALLAAQIAIAALSLWYVRDFYIANRWRPYPVIKLFRESFPFYVDNYVWYLKGDGDTLLAAFLGPVALAEYYIARTLYANVMLVWSAIDRVALERLARVAANKDEICARVSEIYQRIVQTTLPFMTGVMALAPYGIIMLAGTRYTGSVVPAVALLVVALAQLLNIPINRAVFVSLPGSMRLASSSAEAVCVVTLAALLGPRYGIMGIALARILGPIAGGTFGYRVLRSRFGLRLDFAPLVRALATLLPGTLLVLLLAPPAHSFLQAAIYAPAGGCVWIALSALTTFLFDRPLFDVAIKAVAQVAAIWTSKTTHRALGE